MSSKLPVGEMLARLERKIAHHKELGEMHARQEAVHAEQRALHEAEHRKAAERHAALQAASAAVGELIVDVRPEPPATLPKEVARGGWHWIAKLMEMVIETKAPGEAFGATSLIDEIQERWGPQLRYEIDSRSAAVTLRRWAAEGRLEVVRKGKAHHEGLYTKPPESR
ncbi:MAG: hypothetical protein QOH06_131 [Acidobacteriota bacterium]|jgi:hypothetical protein|nr:hypothetical protein [Acidobacteriota bacterium]